MTTTTDMSTLLRRQSSVIFASVSIEEPLCNYLSKFDGTKKNFSDIRHEFDSLFSQNFIHLGDGRHTMDKNTFICMTKHLLEQQMVASVEDLYFVDDTHVEYSPLVQRRDRHGSACRGCRRRWKNCKDHSLCRDERCVCQDVCRVSQKQYTIRPH